MFRVKHLRAIALAVTLVFLFSSVAFAAAPKYVYFQSGSDMVKVDYGKAVNDAMNNDNTLYNAVKQYVGAAEETGAPVIVETDDQKVLDYQKALGAGKRFTDIVNDPAYQANKPEAGKELRVENGQAVIGDVRPAVVEISSITPTDTLGVVEIVAVGTNAEALQAAITPASTVVAKEGAANTYTVTLQNAAYDQEITLQFAAGFQLKAGVNNKVKWASPQLEVKSVSAIDAKTVKVVFPAAVTAEITAAQFKVVQNGQEIQVSAVEKAADNLSATLTLATALSHGDFTINGVTGTIDLQAPKLVKASVNENDRVLTLSYDEALDVNSVPAAGDFTVRVNGAPVTVLPFVDVMDKNVVLTLGNVISSGSTVVIDYKPGAKPIQDASGNKAAALVLQPVTVVPPTLAAPANVQVALEPGAKAKVTWDADATGLAQKYRVEVSVNGGDFVPVKVITKDSPSSILGTSFEYTGNDGQPVSFKVVAVDSKGNEAASEPTSAVTLDGKAPELVSAVVDGDQLVLTYNEALDEKSQPVKDVFTVNVGSSSINVSSVAVSGDKVTLTLSGPVSSADKVTLSYSGSSIKDLAGNAAQAFTEKEVANITKLDKGTWMATGQVAYNADRKAIYQEFQLNGINSNKINLDVNNVVSIEVQKPDGSVQRLTPNSDTTLWFNVLANEPGAYKFTVKTVNGATTEATLNWAGFKTVQATKTGNAGEYETNMYTEFKLGDLNLAADSVVDVFQIKPDGTIADLTPNTDTNLWFKTNDQQAGAHSFLAFYNQGELGTWYKATINYPDDVLPILKDASINEGTLTAEFDLNLDRNAVPSADAFTVKVNGQAVDLDSSNPDIEGKVLTLNLAKPVKVVDSVTLSYKAPSTNKLTGENGLDVKDFTDVAVTNNTSGPVLESATVNSNKLELVFSKVLDETSVPSTSDFVIKVNGVKDAVSKVEVLNDTNKGKVTLTLVVPVAEAQTVSASYTPGANPLKDTAGNPVAAIDEMLVENKTVTTP